MTAPFVHESSYVDDGAHLGAGTKVWHFCHVMSGAVIGERCSLGQNVVVMNGVRLGNNVKVQNNVSIYEGVVIEDDVFCGPSMVFTNIGCVKRGAFPLDSAPPSCIAFANSVNGGNDCSKLYSIVPSNT